MTRVRAWNGRLAWLLLCGAALLPYLPALTVGFAFDDGGLIDENPAVWAAGPGPSWSTPYWPAQPRSGLFRPWVTFSYWLNARLTGRGAAGFHAMNLLIHLAVALTLWRLLRRIFPARGDVAFGTAVVFALHPLHSEAVTAIVGRAELWAALWGLLAYRAAIESAADGSASNVRRRALLVASIGGFALALLSKESTAGLLLLPAAHALLPLGAGTSPDRGTRWRRWWPIGLAWGLTLAFVLLQRRAVLGTAVGLDRPSLSDNVLAHSPVLTRILAALGFQWVLIGRTLFPWTLSADFSYPQLVPNATWMAAGGALLVGLAALLGWALRRRDPELLWGFLLVLAAGAVTANLLFPVGTVLAERLTYLPSGGVLWLGAIAVHRLLTRPRRAASSRQVALIFVATWGIFLFARTTARNFDWKGDLRLFTATAAASPRSAKAWSNLAVAQLKAGRLQDALRSSARSLELLPDYPGALEIRATALTQAGRPAEAIPLLRAALHDPRPRPRSLVELGNAYLSLGQGAPAESAFAAAGRVAGPDDFHPAVGLASAYALQERWSESETVWRRAVGLAPANRDIRRSWAYALWKSGAPAAAEAVYREILAAAPDDASTCNDYAWFLLEARGEAEAALEPARRAFAARPDGTTGDTLLEALRRARGCDASRAWCDSLRSAGFSPAVLEPLETAWRERCKKAPERVG